MNIGSRFARRFVCSNLDEALERVRENNEAGIYGIVNHLGEHSKRRSEVQETVKEYARLMAAIRKNRLDAHVSVKLTHMGLDMDKKYAKDNFVRLVHNARAAGIFVWIDMENARYVDDASEIYESVSPKNAGITIQASLRRSEADINKLMENNGVVRLVKGAYKEARIDAFLRRSDVTMNYERLMVQLFENGGRFAIATHDESLIEAAKILAVEHKTNAEFQLLHGVKEGLKAELAKEFRVGEYVPYGREWYAYFQRRLQENRMNVLWAMCDLFFYRHG